jgi:hypothetical protein
MKSFLNCIVLAGLVVLAACSGDSPRAPAVPTVVPDVWNITALVPSDSGPFVNVPISVTATVAKNGQPAPDGTTVEFLASGGVFASSAGVEASVATDGGEATVLFGATAAGAYVIQARVHAATRQTQVVYREHTVSNALQIWSVNPSEGSYDGGETVVLTGKGIQAPVEVFFNVQGTEYQAIVDQVVPSVPLSNAGTITLRTPEPTAANRDSNSTANIRTVVAVGTADEQQQTLPSAFTFVSDSIILGNPVIFGVQPYFGRSRGGETVTILGHDFAVEMTKELVKNFDEVYFRFRGQLILAQVERWSANQIEVVTPRFSLTPLSQNENAGVVLTRTGGASDVEKSDIFIVLADIAQPVITGVSPTAGPIDGGTVVTLMGHGFEVPIQVLFGTLEATDIQVFNDTTINDNDQITCRTPDYSQHGVVPPYTTTVKVTNLATGNNATAAQTFTFGDTLYVSQASPTEGQIGDLLVLYGAGFEDPLTVWFQAGGQNIEFDVLAVTGTELTLRSPPDLAPTCDDRSGGFRVVLTDGNREATGGNYTLKGSNPTITGVDPIFVNSTSNGSGVTPADIDIYGVRFADELLVLVGSYTINPADVTVETSEHIYVEQIPAPNDFGLVFSTTPCTTGTGGPGIKQVPTPVDVTVRNLPLGCQDTLVQGLVYVPEDQTCRAAPDLSVAPLVFPATESPGPSTAQTIVVSNNGEGDLVISSFNLGGSFYFNAGCSNQAAPGFTVPAFTPGVPGPDVYFCPGSNDGQTYAGQLIVQSNDPFSPEQVPLSAQEAFPILGVSLANLTFNGPYPETQTFDVTNTGSGDLTYTATVAGASFSITAGASGTVVPLGTATVTVEATAADTGTVTVTAAEPDAQGSPQTVELTAN